MKIKANIEYGLEGAFKVDTYDRNNKLVESTDWFSNFITQTGLMYPTIYTFAQCFRFLTIGGDSTTNNKGGDANPTPPPTTGCYSPISAILCDYGNGDIRNQDLRWIGHEAYETGADIGNSACITQLTDNGPIFYRAWSVPTGNAVVGDPAGLNIGEFMVSPSSGGDSTGRYAFSRVIRPLPLPQGYRAVVSYQLKVNIKNSKLTFFSGIFDTGNANVDNDADMVYQWRTLSGYYKQVWCGLSCVDKYGVSFIPKFGNSMEPSLTDFNNYYVYFSPDNAQFDVNPISGGAGRSISAAWASDGTMTPLGDSVRPALTMSPDRTNAGLGSWDEQQTLFYGPEQVLTDIPLGITPFNIRLGSDLVPLKTPNMRYYTGDNEYQDSTFNYQSAGGRFVSADQETISYANPGSGGIRLDRNTQYHERAVFSSRIFRLPMNMDAGGNTYFTGRRKNMSRKVIFAPASSLGYNTRFGSMVYAYKVPNGSDSQGNYTFYPTIDTLFYDSSGRSMLQHYRQISGIYFTSRGSGVVDSTISITNADGSTGINVRRGLNMKTFQGPIYNYNYNGSRTASPLILNSGLFMSGTFYQDDNPGHALSGLAGKLDANAAFSGWGGVLGYFDFWWNNPSSGIFPGCYVYDVGIADNNTGISKESNTGQLYWPNVYGQKLVVTFKNILYSGNPSSSDKKVYLDRGESDAVLAASGFQRPSGYVVHYDALGAYDGTITGYRLLPNYGIANVLSNPQGQGAAIDNYAPTANIGFGGALPGLSLDNGLEIYLDLVWGSPCGTASNCTEPVL